MWEGLLILDLDARCKINLLFIAVGLSIVIITLHFIRLLSMKKITLNLNGSEIEAFDITYKKADGDG